ncbi:MAG TPA: hypothetical protein VNZ26_05440 [Vicinamibacterales bacterium]|jgi:hypothetical protein|nr:hypothetical protein [Vicinamibacterales bacterium]
MSARFKPEDLVEIGRNFHGMAGRRAAVRRREADGRYTLVEIDGRAVLRLWRSWTHLVERGSDLARVALVMHE